MGICADFHARMSCAPWNDESGIYLSDMAGLSHARLSIRDIVTGKQPIIRQKNGKEYAIVYNGELYNTGELARDLRQSGYEFSTTTDTEVILYAYMHYGVDFVQKLNGIFAFAIWDDNKKQLLLYRDRVGIKPLFYSFVSGQLLFASEPKALFCFPGFTPRVSMDGMREVLAIGPARTMGNGIFDDVNEVLPGHYLIFLKIRCPITLTGICSAPRIPIPMNRQWKLSLFFYAIP